jgi:NADH-quinone oxidoreductase subunit E
VVSVTDNGQVFHINTKGFTAVTEPAKLSDGAEARAQEFIARYPQTRSAVMPLLYLAQEELGFINQQAVEWVAQKISLPPVQVWEVATFYTMYYKKPVGRYHIQVCRTLPCALRGAKKISQFVHERLGLQPGEVSADGMWSFEEVECLGSCGTAPMCQINDHFFENLTEEKLDQLLTRIQTEQPDLRLSTVKDDMGTGLSGCPKSQIIES